MGVDTRGWRMMASRMQAVCRSNRILEALTAPSHDRVVRTAVPVSLRAETVLFDPGPVIDAVNFPLRGVVALVAPIEDGGTVAVLTVGKEGIVGVPLVPGRSLAVRAVAAASQVLGSDRRAASLSGGGLAAAGLILDRGERLTILDRAGLESRSCECYRVLRNQLDSLPRERPWRPTDAESPPG